MIEGVMPIGADPADGVPVWPGLPVTCAHCRRGGRPVMTEDGWRLPVHRRRRESYPWGTTMCEGSQGAVEAPPTSPVMEERIEQRFVEAMPERINDDWDTP